ncbi:MAG TPA: hypothetical protein VGH38_37770 [Bryobacteraceae bacterium]
MMNFTTRMMIAAATVAIAAGTASAQAMKADVPFPFRAGGKVMPAGTYRIGNLASNTSNPTFLFQSRQDSVVATPRFAKDAVKAWRVAGDPVLAFDCSARLCALAGIWKGPSTPMYTFSPPTMGTDGPTRMATVVMRPAGTN